MKFKFPLQSVVRHRQIKEDLAERDFMQAQNALNVEVEKLEKMRQDQHDAYLRMGALQKAGGTQGPALVQISEYKKGQDIRIAGQQMKVQEAQNLVEEKREILRQAALEYKIIDKLRDKKFEEYKAERLSAEQKEMDEQSVLRFGVRKDK